MNIRPFQNSDESAVIDLWQKCNLVRSVNNPKKDIQRKLAVNPDLFLVGLIDDKLIATVIAGYEGHRGWINYLAVHLEYRRQGYARQIMVEAEKLLRGLDCPKINLQVRTSNSEVMEFYRRIGYSVDDVVSLGKRLEHDDGKL
jgi:ribosomal protein S18 acetylase RimI-like enzyme